MRVPVEDRDFLQFLWWPGGNLAKGLEEYRMTVHLSVQFRRLAVLILPYVEMLKITSTSFRLKSLLRL